MFVAELFNPPLWKNMGSILFLLMERYMVSTSICMFLKLQHHIHSPYEKSVIEGAMQCIKDRTESFDDYFPCEKKNCKLKRVNIG